MYISPPITDALTVDDGNEGLALHRSVWYQCIKAMVRKSGYIWPLCVQKEDVKLWVLQHSHFIKLGGSETSTSGNLVIINQVTVVLVRMYSTFQVLLGWVICWCVCTLTSVLSCGLVMREGRQEHRHGRQTDNEPMKNPLRRGQGGWSGSLRTHLIRAWVTRELNQITSFPWQSSQFPPFPFTSVISRKGNGAKLPLSDEIYMSSRPLSFLTSVWKCLLSLCSASAVFPLFFIIFIWYTQVIVPRAILGKRMVKGNTIVIQTSISDHLHK